MINEERTVGQSGQRVMESVVKQLLFCAPAFRDVSRENLRGRLPSVGDGCQDHFHISQLAPQPHELLDLRIKLGVLSQMPLTRKEILTWSG
jgi:hypothetical protein